jgi:hypothetical protein
MSANFISKSVNVNVFSITSYDFEPKGITFGVGWQCIITGIFESGTNGEPLDITIFGAHVVDGVTQYVPLHSATLVSASTELPGGTQAGYVSAIIQDPWAKYDTMVCRVESASLEDWDINLSFKTPGPSFA